MTHLSRARPARTAARTVALAMLTPLLEKNVLKTMTLDIPVIFSMSRVIVLAFAIALFRQIWRAGVAGWPDATLTMAIVLALPLLGALDHVKPADALELAKALVSRFGVGGTRSVGSVFSQDPYKCDDHRDDA
jgi:hypothetical protein